MSVLPDWIRFLRPRPGCVRRRRDPTAEYDMTSAVAICRPLAETLDELAEIVGTADDKAMRDLISAPRPRGILRRIPQT